MDERIAGQLTLLSFYRRYVIAETLTGLQIVRSSILPQILCCTAKRKIADSLVVTISDSLRGVTRNRTGDTRIFSPLLYQLSYDTIAFGIAKIDIFFIIPTICENIFYCCIFTKLFLILFEGE